MNNNETKNTDQITQEETDAFRDARDLADRFGWSMSITTRGDVDAVLGRDLTDKEWDTVKGDRWWRDGITNINWGNDVADLLRNLNIDE